MGLLDDAIREHLDLKRRRGADPAEVERAEREALGPVRRNPGPADAPPDDDLIDARGDTYDAAPAGYADASEGYGEPPEAYGTGPEAYDEAPEGYGARSGSVDHGPAVYDDAPGGLEAPTEDHTPASVYDAPGEDDWAEEPAASMSAPADADLGAQPPRERGGTAPIEPVEPAEAEHWSASDAVPAGLEPFPTAPPAAPRATGGDRPGSRGPHSTENDDIPDNATVEYRLEDAPVLEEAEAEDMLEETPEFLQDTPDHDRLWFEQRPPRDFDFDG